MSNNLVPYHYCQWASGRYILKEMNSVESVQAAIKVAYYLGDPECNQLLWGTPGDSDEGFYKPKTRSSRDRNSNLFIILIFLGTLLFWVAVIWLYLHGIPPWLR